MGNSIAIILMGGKGERLGQKTPKQYLKGPNGKPLFSHSVDAFLKIGNINRIILVAPKEYLIKTEKLCKYLFDSDSISVIEGGPSREESAYNALLHIEGQGYHASVIAIHDAARPNVDEALIQKGLEAAQKGLGALPVLSVKDSTIETSEGTVRYLKRENLATIQTPQFFPFPEILEAFKKALPHLSSYNDDGSIFIEAGGKIILFPGSERNYKITTSDDYMRWINGK